MRVIQPMVSTWEMICSRYQKLARWYCKPYEQVVEREIGLAKMEKEDRVLNIGCGAIPFTAILIAQKTKAMVTAMDKNPLAIARARHCIESLGLSHQIRVHEGDGKDCASFDHSVIVVALQAEPKEEILRNLMRPKGKEARILMRIPAPRFRQHYDDLPWDREPVDFVGQTMRTFHKTVLYVRPQE